MTLPMPSGTLQPLGGGYAEVVGLPYGIYVVCTDEGAETEQDDFCASTATTS